MKKHITAFCAAAFAVCVAVSGADSAVAQTDDGYSGVLAPSSSGGGNSPYARRNQGRYGQEPTEGYDGVAAWPADPGRRAGGGTGKDYDFVITGGAPEEEPAGALDARRQQLQAARAAQRQNVKDSLDEIVTLANGEQMTRREYRAQKRDARSQNIRDQIQRANLDKLKAKQTELIDRRNRAIQRSKMYQERTKELRGKSFEEIWGSAPPQQEKPYRK